MFGWRRRSEGFEWKEYVRTTILVRRADRQRRVEDARAAAVAKVKNVADAGAEAGRASVSFMGSQFSKFLWVVSEALLDFAAAAVSVLRRWSKFLLAVLSDAFGAILAPLGGTLGRGIAAVRTKVPSLPKIPDLPDFAQKLPIKSHHVIGALGALGLIYIGGPILRSADGVAVAKFTPDIAKPTAGSTAAIAGRAVAISGDLMRVGGRLVRLSGVEAPDAHQPCHRANGRRWNCASAAKAGLARLIRRRTVSCTPTGQAEGGAIVAQCQMGKTDVAAELVRHGYVFAVRSFFGSLSGEEDAARAAKAGIWQGEILRPQAWRDQQWQEATRDAPDGCPIKGYIRASSKLYALPWSENYDRTKVRTDKGGRWFCSEDDAKAAGFAPSSRS
jgi:endonuclease YncB( thermonuclease family)